MIRGLSNLETFRNLRVCLKRELRLLKIQSKFLYTPNNPETFFQNISSLHKRQGKFIHPYSVTGWHLTLYQMRVFKPTSVLTSGSISMGLQIKALMQRTLFPGALPTQLCYADLYVLDQTEGQQYIKRSWV